MNIDWDKFEEWQLTSQFVADLRQHPVAADIFEHSEKPVRGYVFDGNAFIYMIDNPKGHAVLYSVLLGPEEHTFSVDTEGWEGACECLFENHAAYNL